MHTVEDILEDFETIKWHKPMASKKLEQLGNLIAEAYIIDKKTAIDMWKFLLDYNETDNEKIEEFYTVRICRKVENHLDRKSMVELMISVPQVISSYKKYHGSSWYTCVELIYSFYIENHFDIASDIFINFVEQSKEEKYANCIEMLKKAEIAGAIISTEKERTRTLDFLDELSDKIDDEIIISLILFTRYCLMTKFELSSINKRDTVDYLVKNIIKINDECLLSLVLDYALNKLPFTEAFYFWESVVNQVPMELKIIPTKNDWKTCLNIADNILLSKYYIENYFPKECKNNFNISFDVMIALLAKKHYDVLLEFFYDTKCNETMSILFTQLLEYLKETWHFYDNSQSLNYNYTNEFELSDGEIENIINLLQQLLPMVSPNLQCQCLETIEILNDYCQIAPNSEPDIFISLSSNEGFNEVNDDEFDSLDDVIEPVKNSIIKFGNEYGNGELSFQKVINTIGRNEFENKNYFGNWCYLVLHDYTIAEYCLKNMHGKVSGVSVIEHLVLTNQISKAESLIKEHSEPVIVGVNDYKTQNRWDYRLLCDIADDDQPSLNDKFLLLTFVNQLHNSMYNLSNPHFSGQLACYQYYIKQNNIDEIYLSIKKSFNTLLSNSDNFDDDELLYGLEFGALLAKVEDYDILPSFLSMITQKPNIIENKEFYKYKKHIVNMAKNYLENLKLDKIDEVKLFSIMKIGSYFATKELAKCLYKITKENIPFKLDEFLEHISQEQDDKYMGRTMWEILSLHIYSDGYAYEGKEIVEQLDNLIKFSKYIEFGMKYDEDLTDEWIEIILEEIFKKEQKQQQSVLVKLKLLIPEEKYNKVINILEGEN